MMEGNDIREISSAGSTNGSEVRGTLHFKAGEVRNVIRVQVPNQVLQSKFRWVGRVHLQPAKDSHVDYPNVATIRLSDLDATVNPKDSFAQIEMSSPSYRVTETDGFAYVCVLRVGNCDNKVRVTYCTEDATAREGQDYVPTAGHVTFHSGEASQTIRVPLIEDRFLRSTGDECSFTVRLEDVSAADCQVGKNRTCTVTIKPITVGGLHNLSKRVNAEVNKSLAASEDHIKVQGFAKTYREQFGDLNVVFSSNVSGPKLRHKVLHSVFIVWKFVVALLPPVTWARGSLATVIGSVVLSLIMMQIRDLAVGLSCICGSTTHFFLAGILLPALFAVPDVIADRRATSRSATITATSLASLHSRVFGAMCLSLGVAWMVVGTLPGSVERTTAVLFSEGTLMLAAATAIASAILLARRLPALGASDIGGSRLRRWASGGALAAAWLAVLFGISLVSHTRGTTLY
eukprot:GFYU01007640.1.p1 GENE.GFYU01007640.1~~GFYU01007640.1.p1  ORF type:complete len:467 (-),score=99.29 GFYU01007640.1:94-1473(-)